MTAVHARGTRPRIVARCSILAALAGGCTPVHVAGSEKRPAERTPPEDDEGARVLAELLAGARRLPAGDGPSFLLGKAPGPCAALPDARPAGFYIDYMLVASGDVQQPLLPTRYAVGEDDCEIVWSLLHIGTPEVVCSRYAAAPLDELYGHLRDLEPHTIATRRITDELATIHRGGYVVSWHWPGHACELSDAFDSEVLPESAERFEELVAWMKGACVTAGHESCAGAR